MAIIPTLLDYLRQPLAEPEIRRHSAEPSTSRKRGAEVYDAPDQTPDPLTTFWNYFPQLDEADLHRLSQPYVVPTGSPVLQSEGDVTKL